MAAVEAAAVALLPVQQPGLLQRLLLPLQPAVRPARLSPLLSAAPG